MFRSLLFRTLAVSILFVGLWGCGSSPRAEDNLSDPPFVPDGSFGPDASVEGSDAGVPDADVSEEEDVWIEIVDPEEKVDALIEFYGADLRDEEGHWVLDDMILTSDQLRVEEFVSSNKASSRELRVSPRARPWPGGIVPLQFDAASIRYRELFLKACSRWAASGANIRCVDRTDETQYLRVQHVPGLCSAGVGFGGSRITKIGSEGCIVHELGHVFGFWHEQSRSDRDEYVEILWGNIPTENEHNFRSYDDLVQATPYDFGSVMHYSTTAFSPNGARTITPLPQYESYASDMGQTAIVTEYDGQDAVNLYGAAPVETCGPPSYIHNPRGVALRSHATDTYVEAQEGGGSFLRASAPEQGAKTSFRMIPVGEEGSNCWVLQEALNNHFVRALQSDNGMIHVTGESIDYATWFGLYPAPHGGWALKMFITDELSRFLTVPAVPNAEQALMRASAEQIGIHQEFDIEEVDLPRWGCSNFDIGEGRDSYLNATFRSVHDTYITDTGPWLRTNATEADSGHERWDLSRVGDPDEHCWALRSNHSYKYAIATRDGTVKATENSSWQDENSSFGFVPLEVDGRVGWGIVTKREYEFLTAHPDGNPSAGLKGQPRAVARSVFVIDGI